MEVETVLLQNIMSERYERVPAEHLLQDIM